MQQKQKELISSFIDGESIDHNTIESVSADEDLKACWLRYHIARDAMRGTLHSCSLTLDISNKVAMSIANDTLHENRLTEQLKTDATTLPKVDNLFWVRVKEMAAKVSQVGLAACVTLGIITGVQYYQGKSTSTDAPILNTVPVGVSASPVGGMPEKNDNQLIDKKENDKIRSLIQNYELQKRLNSR